MPMTVAEELSSVKRRLESLEAGASAAAGGLLVGASGALLAYPTVECSPNPLMKLTFVGGSIGAIVCGLGTYFYHRIKDTSPSHKSP